MLSIDAEFLLLLNFILQDYAGIELCLKVTFYGPLGLVPELVVDLSKRDKIGVFMVVGPFEALASVSMF